MQYDPRSMKFVAVERSSIIPSSHDLEDPPLPPPFRPFYIKETLGATEEAVREKLNAWLSSKEALARYGEVLPFLEEGKTATVSSLVTNEHNFLWSYVFVIEPFGDVGKRMLFPATFSHLPANEYALDN